MEWKDFAMKSEKPCGLVLVRNNRRVAGTAAQLAHISECGGWDAFLQRVAEKTLEGFAQTYNAAARRPRLALVPDQQCGKGTQS